MNNYEYIIAGLPDLAKGSYSASGLDADGIVGEIREQCDVSDRKTIDLLLEGFDTEKLGAEFYTGALSCPNRFIREYFKFDLGLRNTKVRFINKSLNRIPDQDVLILEGREDEEFEEEARADAVLGTGDILERERGLDNMMWDKIEELTILETFNLDVILGFIARLQIIQRWLRLDPRTGREMFRKLVEEIRNNR